jgi:hypothetical protein
VIDEARFLELLQNPGGAGAVGRGLLNPGAAAPA